MNLKNDWPRHDSVILNPTLKCNEIQMHGLLCQKAE